MLNKGRELEKTKAELEETKANVDFVSSGYAKLLQRFEPPELPLLPPLKELSKSSTPNKLLSPLQPSPPSEPRISDRKRVPVSLRKFWDTNAATVIAQEERDAVMHTFQQQLDDINSIHLASDFVTALRDIQHQVNELKYMHHLNFDNRVSAIELKIKELSMYKTWCGMSLFHVCCFLARLRVIFESFKKTNHCLTFLHCTELYRGVRRYQSVCLLHFSSLCSS